MHCYRPKLHSINNKKDQSSWVIPQILKTLTTVTTITDNQAFKIYSYTWQRRDTF